MNAALLFLGIFFLVIVNVPIAISLGLAAVVATVLTQGSNSLLNLPIEMFNGATSFPLIAIPLFVLAGAIMNASGISRRLIELASSCLGFIRGALSLVTIGTTLFFAEISGSAVADVAALGSILSPAMQSKGYTKEFSAAVLSSSATLAVIIPPSIPMILYAAMAQTSVVKVFVSGIIPGVLGGLLMMGVSYWFARRYDFPVDSALDLRRIGRALRSASWALLLPVIILGGIFGGVVTATEGAGLAVVAAMFIGFIVYRELNVRHLWAAMVEGAVQTSVVMLLVAASVLLSSYLTTAQIPQELTASVLQLTHNKYLVLLLLNFVLLFLGLFLHSAAAIILVVPIVMPLVHAVGIDPVHFGLVVTINLGIGQQTPPMASVLTTACAVAKADMWEVTKVNVYYVAVLVFILVLVTYLPVVPMSLVHLFYG